MALLLVSDKKTVIELDSLEFNKDKLTKSKFVKRTEGWHKVLLHLIENAVYILIIKMQNLIILHYFLLIE